MREGWMKVSLECSWDLIWKYFNTRMTQNNVYLFVFPWQRVDWCELNKIFEGFSEKGKGGGGSFFEDLSQSTAGNEIFYLSFDFTLLTHEWIWSQWIINIWKKRQQKAATSEKRAVSPKIMLHCSFFLLSAWVSFYYSAALVKFYISSQYYSTLNWCKIHNYHGEVLWHVLENIVRITTTWLLRSSPHCNYRVQEYRF